MPRFAFRRRTRIGIAAAAAALAGCAPDPIAGRFSRTGELVALSGGDAGPHAACFTCHGRAGEGDGDRVPRLAGLDRGYLARQLELFAIGQRQDPHMHGIAKRLTGADRLRVSAYYAAMTPPPARSAPAACLDSQARRLYLAGDPQRGLPACASCHGKAGEGGGPGNPPLAGQPPAYLAEQLRKWRAGERYGDPGHVMHDAALALTAEETAALAALAPALASHSREFPAECP